MRLPGAFTRQAPFPREVFIIDVRRNERDGRTAGPDSPRLLPVLCPEREARPPRLEGERHLDARLGVGVRPEDPCLRDRPDDPRPRQRRPGRDPLGEPPRVADGRLRHARDRRDHGPDLHDVPGPAGRVHPARLRREGPRRLEREGAREGDGGEEPLPGPGLRRPRRREGPERRRSPLVRDRRPAGRGGAEAAARRLGREGRERQPRVPRHDHLHLGDDGRAEGGRPLAREPRLERLDLPRRSSTSVPGPWPCRSSRSPTSSSG